MPTNLYGPNDNFDLKAAHVLPALIRKFHEAKGSPNHPIKQSSNQSVVLWGTGKPKREFLYVDDLADACIYLMNKVNAKEVYDKDITHLNIGTGKDLSINELADLIAEVVGYKGDIEHDTTKPDGTPRKLLDISRIQSLGWNPKIGLKQGVELTYNWFLNNYT